MKKRLLIGCVGIVSLVGLGLGSFLFLLIHRTPGEFFDSNGVRIYYTASGHGQPVILIHGLAATSDLNWRRPGVVRRLAKHFRVITFDLRGHGLSGQPTDPEAYGIEMVEDVVRLMDHLQIDKAHVAGYSLGGFLALKLIATHPDRIRKAAICAAGWKNPEDPSEIPNPYSPPASTRPAAASTPVAMAAGNKGLFHFVRNAVSDRLVNKVAIKALKKNYQELGVTREELQANTVPTLCLIGRQDGLLPLAEDLKDNMANVEFVYVGQATHFSLPFYPEFKSRLDGFFSE